MPLISSAASTEPLLIYQYPGPNVLTVIDCRSTSLYIVFSLYFTYYISYCIILRYNNILSTALCKKEAQTEHITYTEAYFYYCNNYYSIILYYILYIVVTKSYLGQCFISFREPCLLFSPRLSSAFNDPYVYIKAVLCRKSWILVREKSGQLTV